VRAACHQGAALNIRWNKKGSDWEETTNISREITEETPQNAPRLWLDQPSIVGLDSRGRVVAGNEAKERAALEPGVWTMQTPMRSGTVADPAMLSHMLRRMLHSARLPLFGINGVCLAISGAAEQREIDTLHSALQQAGIKRIRHVPAPIAVARQAGLSLQEPLGQMVLSLGAGVTEAAILTMDDLAVCRRSAIGGQAMDEAIAAHLRRSKGVVVGLAAAEEIKRHLAGAIRPKKIASQVWGRDLETGLPRSVSVTGQEICAAIAPVLEQMLAVAKQVMLEASPELVGDLSKTGILLWGGSAQLYGMTEYCRRQLGVPVHIADHPMSCAAMGAAM